MKEERQGAAMTKKTDIVRQAVKNGDFKLALKDRHSQSDLPE